MVATFFLICARTSMICPKKQMSERDLRKLSLSQNTWYPLIHEYAAENVTTINSFNKAKK